MPTSLNTHIYISKNIIENKYKTNGAKKHQYSKKKLLS